MLRFVSTQFVTLSHAFGLVSFEIERVGDGLNNGKITATFDIRRYHDMFVVTIHVACV